MSALRGELRRGFTLMEIVLVLAIMIAAAAIAAPMFAGTMKRERLRKGAELIAADWTRTRAVAMQNGETQVWVCQVGGNSYSKSSYTESGMTTADASSLVANTTVATPVSAGSDAESFGDTLPHEVTIGEILVSEADTVTTMAQTATSGESGSGTVFFYPDGTCSSARLTVQNEDQSSMTVVMNGLAGTVRVLAVQQVQ